MTTAERLNEKIGPCPVCGKTRWWYNDVPLKAFCWGPNEDEEHDEVSFVVPEEYFEED